MWNFLYDGRLLAALVAIIMTTGAQAKLPAEALPLASFVVDRVPAEAKPKELVALAEEVLSVYPDGYNAGSGPYLIEPLTSLISATLGIEKAAVAGEAVDGALVQAYYTLFQVANLSVRAIALEDLGTPLDTKVPAEEAPRAVAYMATIKMLPDFASKRIAELTAQSKDARALRYRTRLHWAKLELKEMATWAKKAAKADPNDAAAAFEVAVAEALVLKTEAGAKKRLARDVKGEFEQRARAAVAMGVHARLLDVRQAEAALAKDASLTNQLKWLDAQTALYPAGAGPTYEAMRAVEKLHPNSGDVKLHRAAWLMVVGDIESSLAVVELIDTGSLAVEYPKSIGRRLAARVAELYGAAMTGQFDQLAKIAERAQGDAEKFEAKDAYPRDMALMYMEIVRRIVDDEAIVEGLKGEAGIQDDKVRARVLGIVGDGLKRLGSKYDGRADMWRLKLVHAALSEGEAVADKLAGSLAKMDKKVSVGERNEADMFAGLALLLAGRRKGGAKRFVESLARFEKVHARWRAHRKAMVADNALKLTLCSKEGCFDVGGLYAYIGAVRNMISADKTRTKAVDRPAWDQGTIQLMREGDRALRELQGHYGQRHAQILGHRCWVQFLSGDFQQAGQCLNDLWVQHRTQPGARVLYAAGLFQAGNKQAAAHIMSGLVDNPTAPAAVKYDAHKWLAQALLGAGENDRAKEHIRKALALRPDVQRLGAELFFAFLAIDGNFNLGIGVNADGDPVHQVTLGAGVWSLLTAPVDEARMEQFLKTE